MLNLLFVYENPSWVSDERRRESRWEAEHLTCSVRCSSRSPACGGWGAPSTRQRRPRDPDPCPKPLLKVPGPRKPALPLHLLMSPFYVESCSEARCPRKDSLPRSHRDEHPHARCAALDESPCRSEPLPPLQKQDCARRPPALLRGQNWRCPESPWHGAGHGELCDGDASPAAPRPPPACGSSLVMNDTQASLGSQKSASVP